VHGTASAAQGAPGGVSRRGQLGQQLYAIVDTRVCYLVLKGRARLGSLTLWMLIIGFSRFAQPASLGL
jgi:hypothetical protein